MTIARHRLLVPSLALALLALIGALGLGLLGARQAPAMLPATAAQRPPSATDRIIWDYQEIARREPDNANAFVTLGMAYLQKVRESGDPSFYEKAEGMFDQGLRADPQQSDALVGKGVLALARHDFRNALVLGERARSLSPATARTYGVIADAQIELGMYEQATATIQTMVDLRPDLASYSRVAYARELYGDTTGAIEAMELALSAGGPTAENTEWTRVQLGNLHFAQGDLAAAEAQYQRSLAQMPGYVHALAGLARVRAAQGQVDEAESLYRQASARVPLPEHVIGLGEMLEAAGRASEAAQQYKLVRAMQQLQAQHGVDTDMELALFETDHGADPHLALSMARAAYERRPSVKAADALAWALHRTGEYDAARRAATEALRLGTQDSTMLYHAGMIALAQGDTAAARTYLERALALNPQFAPLQARTAQQALNGMGR